MPLFAGKYLFIAEFAGRTIRINENSTGYDNETGLVTIKNAVTDIDFIDYSTREITVYVEDSGGFPIDTYQDNKIIAQVNGDNGFAEGEVVTENVVYFKAVVPPGEYSISLPNVPTAFVKDDTAKSIAEVDVRGQESDSVTMVVPVPIVLEITPAPRLLDPMPAEFLDEIGLNEEDNPEGYMIYFPPDIQTHTYTIIATANGNPVTDITLKVTDNISQLSHEPASEVTYPKPMDERYDTDDNGNVLYTIGAGLPKSTTVDENDPDTYLEFTMPDNSVIKVPKVLPKNIKFQATKDGYEDSAIYTKEVTVLGDITQGSESELVSVPNVNYFVLHDPPGDCSYSYLEDTMTVKGVLGNMKITVGDQEISVYPSPWSVERNIDGVNYEELNKSGQDLGNNGLLDYHDADGVGTKFSTGASIELGIGATTVALGPYGFILAVAKMATTKSGLESTEIVQYEVSPTRYLQTNAEDEYLSDLMGPGKGDLYYGEGWTLALQSKCRLGIKLNPDYNSNNPDSKEWIPDTAQILTFDIMERENQYIYTIRDILNIINDLTLQVAALGEPEEGSDKEKEKEKLESALQTWQSLLNNNPAYIWQKNYVNATDPDDPEYKPNRDNLEKFMEDRFSEQEGELLIFSAGTTFEYSRTVGQSQIMEYSTSLEVGTSVEGHFDLDIGTGDIRVSPMAGPNLEASLTWGLGSAIAVSTGHSYSSTWESGTEVKQTVGFVLQDDDIGDNISTYVFEGPWGTPLFLTDPGSVTSDPWQKGTNKGVDAIFSLISEPTRTLPFDYSDGAHYRVKIEYNGLRNIEVGGFEFEISSPPEENTSNLIVRFNGDTDGGFNVTLDKRDKLAEVVVSIYPPEVDRPNAEEKEYDIQIESESVNDPQIRQLFTLTPNFADLSSPRATITAPYDGQRISPAVFTGDKKFEIKAYSDDHDTAKIQIQIRSKKTDGVWEPWRLLSGMAWKDPDVHQDADNSNVTVVTHTDREPVRREFTFEWSGDEISSLGVGEYALRAVAEDKATRLKEDGTQELKPNVDLDAPIVSFKVDGSKPTVLTTVPFYQDRESERIYRGELSVTFNDDMRATDFSDRTFYVTDLLDNQTKVAGFVSYSPALRKTLFVPQVPFKPNGFYFVKIKTDKEENGTIDKGLHDLAGNPLDNEFTMTFRTKDTPFEEQWSIILSATDGVSTDANNIAAVEYGVSDGEDERDAHAVPGLYSEFRLSFVNHDGAEFERDVRPADGRLSHHWFFAIKNPQNQVTISYKPSVKLAKSPDLRQYKVVKLLEFDGNGNISNNTTLNPENSTLDVNTGEYTALTAYTYAPAQDETIRYFRLDVQKASLVATTLEKGSSKWKFFSAPITPQVADPFVNLGDDIEPFKLYRYDTKLNGYKIYPLDIGEVSLITGHGYFTRLEGTVEIDVGGASNNQEQTINLANAGWHAIGNPFVKPVNVADLRINGGKSFVQAVNEGLIQGTLYSWKTDLANSDSYEALDLGGSLEPWEGYWMKTESDNLTLTIPAPTGLANFIPLLPDSYQPPMSPASVALNLNEAKNLGEFDLRFVLTSDSSSDLITTLGTRQEARVEKDVFDQSEPPILDGTVAAYFSHRDWQVTPGWYNVDYQPILEVGEQWTWKLVVVHTAKQKEKMQLSWEDAINKLPSDVMFAIRQLEGGNEEIGEGEWVDMREMQLVNIETKKFVTKEIFEIRAERFAMTLPDSLSVVAGEKQIKISWSATDNPFITGYEILRVATEGRRYEDGEAMCYSLEPNASQFIDTDVEEEATYTYQLLVHFKTGAEIKSEPFIVTVLPIIKKTVLLQSYPNPFNPETWIPYELSRESNVKIEVYNVNGQLVRTLDFGLQPRGRYTSKDKAAYWNGRNELGEKAASGVYFYIMKTGKFTAIRKMAIIK